MVKTGTIQDKPICLKWRKSKEMKRAATATALKRASTSVILADIEINSNYPDIMNAASPPNYLRVFEETTNYHHLYGVILNDLLLQLFY